MANRNCSLIGGGNYIFAIRVQNASDVSIGSVDDGELLVQCGDQECGEIFRRPSRGLPGWLALLEARVCERAAWVIRRGLAL